MTRPPMSAVSTRAPLRRASDDRLVLGVCGGVARSLELAPLAVRLFAVALAAVAAPLVLGLYVVLAAIVPRDDGRVLLGGAPADRRESLLGWALIGVTLVWFAAEEFRLGGLVWPALSSFGVFAAASSALVLLALAQRREAPGAVVTPAAAAASDAPAAPGEAETPRPAAADGDAVTMPQPTAETAVQPPLPPPPKRGPSLAVLAFGALLVVGAVVFLLVALGVTDPSAGGVAAALGAGAALAGAGAIAGAVARRRGVLGLLALGVVLGTAAVGVAVFQTELDDGVGLRTERPLTVSEISETYRLGAGRLEIDLRGTDLPAGPTTVRARVGAGELDVYVPAGVRVESIGPTYVAGVGRINAALRPGKLPENKRRAAKERRARARAAAARPVVRVDADVLEGDAEVIRVGG